MQIIGDTWGIFYGLILAFALYDGTRDWSQGNGLNHTFRASLRAAIIVLISFHEYGFDAYYTAGAFKLASYRYVIFWVAFDLLVNMVHFRRDIFRYRQIGKLFHLGETAFLDWVFRAAWGATTKPEHPINRTNLIGATITQYVFKVLLLIVTYQWFTYTSDTYLF